MRLMTFVIVIVLVSLGLPFAGMASTPASPRTITDAAGRNVSLPPAVEHVICSGAGALRLLTYLQCQDRIVAVDDMEGPAIAVRRQTLCARQPPIQGLSCIRRISRA
jgi:ABC-type Fe3+-hydroxamate transport system substrate-binding protein